MKDLIRLITFRHLFNDPLRTVFLLLGIGLGVAVYVSINIAVGTAVGAFRDTVNAVAGKTQIQIMGQTSSLDERLFLKVKRIPFVKAAAPVVETVAQIEGQPAEPIILLGIDIFSDKPFRDYRYLVPNQKASDIVDFLTDPKAIVVSEGIAKKYGLKKGDSLRVTTGSRSIVFKINSILAAEGPACALQGAFAILDIAAAQEFTDKIGRLDRIDLIIEEGTQTDAALEKIKAILPPGVTAVRPDSRGLQVEKMLGSYSLNLFAFSLVAFLVGIFLIYSSMSFSVARRHKEIGILRALGVSRRQVWMLFIIEGGLYGAAGGVLGGLLGLLIAKGTSSIVAQSITSLYLLVRVENIKYSWPLFFRGGLISILISLVAAIWPARQAARVNPKEVFQTGLVTSRSKWKGWSFSLSFVLLTAALFLSLQRPISGRPIFGFTAAFFVILGFALMVPAFAWVTTSILRRILRLKKWSEAELSVSYLGETLGKTALPMAAMVAVLTMVIGLMVMVTSFRQAVNAWLDQYISGDIFVSPSLLSTARHDAFLPDEILRDLSKDPDIHDMYIYRHVRFTYDGIPTVLTAGDMAVLARHGQINFKEGGSNQILKKVAEGEGVIVSETFAEGHKIGRGGQVILVSPAGRITFPVLGVFVDYRTDGGGIWMDRSVFVRYWRDARVDTARLYLRDKRLLPKVMGRIKRTYFAGYRLFALSHADLKAHVLKIFDQTFTITYVLEFIALIVAALGITNTFLVHIVDRQRDIGILRAMGATKMNIIRLIVTESGIMGLISYILAAVAGTFLSLILIFVINKQSFGWTISPAFQPDIYLFSLAFTVFVSVFASLVPAVMASRSNILQAIRIE